MRPILPVFFTALMGALLGACSRSAPTIDTAESGEMPQLHSKATTAQLMHWILDPQADIVWAATGSIVTEKGEEVLAPKTDAQWIAVRNAAAIVAETGNLLLVPPHSRASDDWAEMTRAMIDKANACLEAAEAKDLDALFTEGGDLYLACTACHAKYVVGASAPAGEAK